MTGITAIIAVIALLVGLASIWLVTEAMKKTETRTQRLIDAHIKGLRQTVTEMTRAIKKIQSVDEAQTDKIKEHIRLNQQLHDQLSEVRQELDAVGKTLAGIGHNPRGGAKGAPPARRNVQ